MRRLKNLNGFSLIESLVTLLCSLVCLSLCTSLLQVCRSAGSSAQNRQDQLAVLQIREIISLSSYVYAQDGKLISEDEVQSFVLEFHNNRIVKRTGYQILLENVQNASFFEEGEKLYLEYTKNNQTKTFQVGWTK